MIRRFINLTNGIEAIPSLSSEYSFIRIQSTACEQKRWDFIIQDLDYNFLMSLAMGFDCVVYDFGARKKKPRAVYQGIEWIKYVLERRWFGREAISIVRGANVTKYFREVYHNLDNRTLVKVDYFRKFINTDAIHLQAITDATDNDGNYLYYFSILKEAI